MWWMAGCDGRVPIFYSEKSSGRALAACMADLVEEKMKEGIELNLIQEAIHAMNPRVIAGPLSLRQAYELALGWGWAASAALQENRDVPVEPIGREEAVSILGEQKTLVLESRLRERYGMSRTNPGFRVEREGNSPLRRDGNLRKRVVELYSKKRQSIAAIVKELRLQGFDVAAGSVVTMLDDAGVTRRSTSGGRGKLIISNLEELAERNKKGESLRTLSEEIGVAQLTLTLRLEEAGLKNPPASRRHLAPKS